MDMDLTATPNNHHNNQDEEAPSFSHTLDLTDPQKTNQGQTENQYGFNGETVKPNKASAQQQQQQDYGGFSNTLDIETPYKQENPDDPNYDASHRYANSNSNYDGTSNTEPQTDAFANALDDGDHDKPGDSNDITQTSESSEGSNTFDEETIRQRNRRRRCLGGGGLAAIVLVWLFFGGVSRSAYSYTDGYDDGGANVTMAPMEGN